MGKKSKTSAATRSTGSLSTTEKKAFRSKATVRNAFSLVRPATNSK